MISYIKIIGPPIQKTIIALEKIAVDLPDVCIMDFQMLDNFPKRIAEDIGGWFSSRGVVVPVERCTNVISKSGANLGEYDFFFEWNKKPSMEQIVNLIERIDEALIDIGSSYTITTKSR